MRHRTSGSTIALKAVCATIFAVFLIKFIYSFQGDVLAMIQYAWSGHETHYDRTIGTVVIVAVCAIVTGIFLPMSRLPISLYSLHFAPAVMLVTALTSVEVDADGKVTMEPVGLIGSLTILLTVIILSRMDFSVYSHSDYRHVPLFSHTWFINMLLSLLVMVSAFCLSNNDRVLHTQLAVERLCSERKYKEAAALGLPQHDHGSSLTMLRALSLSRQPFGKYTMLGERLFCYNIDGRESMQGILIRQGRGGEPRFLLHHGYGQWQALGFVPRNLNEPAERYLLRELRRGTSRPAAVDYLLCNYLLRKQLRNFVEAFHKYYKIEKGDDLPKNYAEALTMYYGSTAADSSYVSPAMKADYRDFMTMMRKYKVSDGRQARIRDAYFGTYWYYYYTAEPSSSQFIVEALRATKTLKP